MLEGAYDAVGRAVGRRAGARRLERRARDRPRQPARRRHPQRAAAPDLVGGAKAGRDPVRLRPQARQRRRARPTAGRRLITKGAFHHVLEICTRSADGAAARRAPRGAPRGALSRPGANRGIRVLAVASRERCEPQPPYGREIERDLTFVGFLTFLDRPKDGRRRGAFADLAALGVSVKLITGDSKPVAQHVAGAGRPARRPRAHRAAICDELPDEALWRAAESHRPLRRGRSESEGADHPGAQEDGPRRRLSRRRRERRAGHACGGHEPVGRAGGGRRPGGGRLRPARAQPGRDPPRHRGRAARRSRTR